MEPGNSPVFIDSMGRHMPQVMEAILAEELPPFPVRRWTVAEYRQLAEKGFLTEEDRVELLEGWIVPKMTKNPPHDSCVQRLTPILVGLLPVGWSVRIQSAINTLTSEPEPDACIVRGSADDYQDRHPGGGDIELVIEVADTSLTRDRRKAGIYAEIGVPVYWIINLRDGCVEAYEQPDESTRRYQSQRTISRQESVKFALVGQAEIELPASQFIPSAAQPTHRAER